MPYRALRGGVCAAAATPFADIANEADAAARKYHQKLLSRCGPDGLWDPSSIAKKALYHGIDVYEDLYFVKRQLIGLAIAGLFHLWEKLSKEMIDIEVRHITTKLPSSEEIAAKWKIKHIRRTLDRRGLLIDDHIWREIHIAELLTNTIKHGGGPSCSKLKNEAPELFDQHYLGWTLMEPRLEWLLLDREKFERFSKCFLQFWQNIPRSITYSSIDEPV